MLRSVAGNKAIAQLRLRHSAADELGQQLTFFLGVQYCTDNRKPIVLDSHPKLRQYPVEDYPLLVFLDKGSAYTMLHTHPRQIALPLSRSINRQSPLHGLFFRRTVATLN